jgi:FSR family fosmidomycin resistance protein-like MFS transporter
MNKKPDERGFIQKRLYFYHFLNDGITFVLPVLMASFFIAFNLNWFQTGLIFAFNAFSLLLFQIVIGYWTDKYSKKLMIIGLFLLSLSSFLMIFSFNFLSLLIFATFSGFALAFQHSISYSTTSKMYHERQAIMIGRQGAAGDVGKCVAVFTSALIIIFFSSWQIVLLLWSFLTFTLFIVIFSNFRNVIFEDYFNQKEKINEIEDLEPNINSNKFLIFLIGSSYVIYAAVYTMLITNLAIYLKVEKIGIVSEFSELILGFTIFAGVLGAFLSGVAKNKFGMSNSMILFSILIIILSYFYISLNSNDLLLTLIFFGLIGFFLFTMYPQLLASVSNFTYTKKIGLGFGIVLSLGWFGNFLGALMGGYFANLYSPNVFFILSIFILTLIIVFALIMKFKYNQ